MSEALTKPLAPRRRGAATARREIARGILRVPQRLSTRVVVGGSWRGRLLAALLLHHHRGRIRLAWRLATHAPHFTDFAWVATEFAFGEFTASHFNRAFFTAELLQPVDRVLDIGCGDGFADRRPHGIFTGSEALGRTEGGYDHLRFFDSLDELADLVRGVFPHVRTRELTYPVPGGVLRREGYWRAAMDPGRIEGGWS